MKNDNNASAPRHIYDVLIVGAGPVGLATAIALYKRGIHNIRVIDQTREFRNVGQGLDLLPNGLRAIKYIDSEAYEHITEAAFKGDPAPTSSGCPDQSAHPPKNRWRQINVQGETTRSFPTDFQSWFDRYGEGRVNVSWFNLQTALRRLLPSELVQANHRCVDLAEEVGRVRVDVISDTGISTNPFAHWEMAQSKQDTAGLTQDPQGTDHPSFYARLVIAADGINSTIRQVLYNQPGLKQWAKPQYSGFAAISSTLQGVSSSMMETLVTQYMKEARIITVHNNADDLNFPDLKRLRLLLIRLPNNTVVYLLYAPFTREAWQHKSPSEILSLGIETLQKAEFPPLFTHLVGLSHPERLSLRPFYMHPVNPQNKGYSPWRHGRVILVGDAAHAMPPFMAQGVNQGFEDAAVIGTLIAQLMSAQGWDQDPTIATTLEKYEHLRQPFMDQVQTATMDCHQWTQAQWDTFNETLHRRAYPSAATLGALN
ncbi:NAD(P)/FAD-dependent oxidoreductase [Acaryochloris sp. IP29b_bin.148]|uniref:FAD-dependent oxidoreductase n=1 Tax=Acaryochloris sp. IP29b_bin.148 TaxID=2969218 RepID=UPI00262C1ACB|nr:NAD(P)/FAD-dependent oxidoreductase [Acaryochloris sp. IP29b_bin.148]